MSISTRLAKLERYESVTDTPVWCDTEAEVSVTVRAMLVASEINERDIGRCLFWPMAAARNGAHEAALAALA
jgi:hypothetical protein